MNWFDNNEQVKEKDYYNSLYEFVAKEYAEHTCYPPFDDILKALNLTPFDKVKCVIIGQDPYHNVGQAMGLSFSVPDNIAIPKSLENIYKELQNELGCYIPNNGNLTKWALQGVLLLNSVLTVRAHEPASHGGHGWETYTDNLLTALNAKNEPVVYMLWGNFAKSKKELITAKNALILEAAHPSPFSANRGFFGCNHFKTANEYLARFGVTPIDWQIENI